MIIFSDSFLMIFHITIISCYFFFIMVLLITVIISSRKQKKIKFKCTKNECRFYDERLNCILGCLTLNSCPYADSSLSEHPEQ